MRLTESWVRLRKLGFGPSLGVVLRLLLPGDNYTFVTYVNKPTSKAPM